jgi:hypothetical protein
MVKGFIKNIRFLGALIILTGLAGSTQAQHNQLIKKVVIKNLFPPAFNTDQSKAAQESPSLTQPTGNDSFFEHLKRTRIAIWLMNFLGFKREIRTWNPPASEEIDASLQQKLYEKFKRYDLYNYKRKTSFNTEISQGEGSTKDNQQDHWKRIETAYNKYRNPGDVFIQVQEAKEYKKDEDYNYGILNLKDRDEYYTIENFKEEIRKIYSDFKDIQLQWKIGHQLIDLDENNLKALISGAKRNIRNPVIIVSEAIEKNQDENDGTDHSAANKKGKEKEDNQSQDGGGIISTTIGSTKSSITSGNPISEGTSQNSEPSKLVANGSAPVSPLIDNVTKNDQNKSDSKSEQPSSSQGNSQNSKPDTKKRAKRQFSELSPAELDQTMKQFNIIQDAAGKNKAHIQNLFKQRGKRNAMDLLNKAAQEKKQQIVEQLLLSKITNNAKDEAIQQSIQSLKDSFQQEKAVRLNKINSIKIDQQKEEITEQERAVVLQRVKEAENFIDQIETSAQQVKNEKINPDEKVTTLLSYLEFKTKNLRRSLESAKGIANNRSAKESILKVVTNIGKLLGEIKDKISAINRENEEIKQKLLELNKKNAELDEIITTEFTALKDSLDEDAFAIISLKACMDELAILSAAHAEMMTSTLKQSFGGSFYDLLKAIIMGETKELEIKTDANRLNQSLNQSGELSREELGTASPASEQQAPGQDPLQSQSLVENGHTTTKQEKKVETGKTVEAKSALTRELIKPNVSRLKEQFENNSSSAPHPKKQNPAKQEIKQGTVEKNKSAVANLKNLGGGPYKGKFSNIIKNNSTPMDQSQILDEQNTQQQPQLTNRSSLIGPRVGLATLANSSETATDNTDTAEISRPMGPPGRKLPSREPRNTKNN